jgi:taurine dioxygenase
MQALQDAPIAQAAASASAPPSFFTLERCTPAIGAWVRGLDMREHLTPAQVAEFRAALVKHKVLFLESQDITPADHVRFAQYLGEPEIHPMLNHHPDHPEMVVFDRSEKRGRENIFHSDVSWSTTPSMGAVLRCVESPEVGGDTIWVNMAAVYAALPEATKTLLRQLNGVHDALPLFGMNMAPERYAKFRAELPPQAHPAVRTHPESGELILYVNQAFTTHFENFAKVTADDYRTGLDFKQAEMNLLQELFKVTAAPEYQVRLKWKANTVAIWDNRSTQHYAVADYMPARRVMNRASIVGERPF